MQSSSKENVFNVEAATQQPKQPAGSFQRGTVEFLNAELKSVALEQKNSKKHNTSTIKPKTLIKRRAKKELDALFDYLSNNGIVQQKDVLKLVDLAPTKLVKKQLEDIGDKLESHQYLDRSKFIRTFTEHFYMKPLLRRITSEYEAEKQVSGQVELSSIIQTFLRREKFQTIHNRFDTGKEERAAERRRIKRREKMAKNMLKAAKVTKTIRRNNSIMESFEQHKRAQMLHPELDGIEEHEVCEMYTWIFSENGPITGKAAIKEIYSGSHGVHCISANKNSVYFSTSYGDLMSYKYKPSSQVPADVKKTATQQHGTSEAKTVQDLQDTNIAQIVDSTWGRKIQDICIAKNFYALIVKNKLFTWGEKNIHGCLGHKHLPTEIDKMTIPEHEDLLYIVNEKSFLNHTTFKTAKKQYLKEHDAICYEMSMVNEGFEHLIEHPWKVQDTWKKLLEQFDNAMYNAGPQLVPSIRNVRIKSVRCSGIHVLALAFDGRVYSWGKNEFGSLGLGSTKRASCKEPQLIEALTRYESKVCKVECGEKHSIALLKDGKVLTWGRGSSGQLGHSDYLHQSTPKVIEAMSTIPINGVHAGLSHTALITVTGRVFTFGSNWYGQLGRKIVVKKRTLAETLKIAQNRLKQQATDESGRNSAKEAEENFESRSMDPNPKEIHTNVVAEKFHKLNLSGNGTVAITQFNNLYVSGETIYINHLEKLDSNANFANYGRIMENEKLRLVDWKTMVKEHKLNRGLINHMDEIYNGSDDLGCVDSDIRLLNSVLIDNGLVFVIAAKKREFRKNEGRNNDKDSSTKK